MAELAAGIAPFDFALTRLDTFPRCVTWQPNQPRHSLPSPRPSNAAGLPASRTAVSTIR